LKRPEQFGRGFCKTLTQPARNLPWRFFHVQRRHNDRQPTERTPELAAEYEVGVGTIWQAIAVTMSGQRISARSCGPHCFESILCRGRSRKLAEYRAPQSTDLDQVLEAIKRLEEGQQTNETLAELAAAIRVNNELQRDSNDTIRELARQIAAPRTIVTDAAGKPIGVTIKAD